MTEPAGGPFELRIEKLVAGGDGLGRHHGLPVFVPRSAPGDRLRVQPYERRAGFARAEILEILEPGPGRRHPPCPYFERCGGCDLQHLEDSLQLRLKVEAARETLERLGGVEWPLDVEVVAGAPWAYRLRNRLRVEARPEGVVAGYLARATHLLVPVDACPILDPALEKLIASLPARLPDPPPRRLDCAVGEDGSVTLSPVLPGLPHGEVSRQVGEFTFAYDARCFFQAHRELLGELVDRVVGPWQGEEAVDLYAGVGLFALPLARRYRRVRAVEGDRIAARFARINGRRNRVRNLEVVSTAVESWLRRLPPGIDRVVADPPRIGLTPAARRSLVAGRPRRLTYVSCHPAALARDLRELATVYRLEGLTLLDLFPQTGHIEAVAQLAVR